jgi:hypothetical protein
MTKIIEEYYFTSMLGTVEYGSLSRTEEERFYLVNLIDHKSLYINLNVIPINESTHMMFRRMLVVDFYKQICLVDAIS